MGAAGSSRKKSDFSWDTEQHLGFVPVHSHKQLEAKRVTKDGQDYVNIVEWRYFRDDWNPIKGCTIPASQWEQLNALVVPNLEENPPEAPYNPDEEGED